MKQNNITQPHGKADILPETTGEPSCESIGSPPLAAKASDAQARSPAISHAAANERELLKPSSTASKSCNQSGNKSSRDCKPNCYECKHRGCVAGSAHSSCNHPDIVEEKDDPLMQVLGILGSVGRGPGLMPSLNTLGVVGATHGIRNGWFNWPVNFDPVWLKTCNGFEAEQ